MNNSDAYFCIGKTHILCQDYAEATEDFAIISDGCSSAIDSHIGSLLLTRAARLALKVYDEALDVFTDVQKRVISYSQSMELPQESLFATLGFVKATEKGFSVGLYGDGVVVARLKQQDNWKYNVFVRDFPSGAPYYLAYQINENYNNQYLNQFSNLTTTTLYNLSNEEYDFVCKNDGLICDHKFWQCCFPYDYYDMVAVISDGVLSFQKLEITGTSKRKTPVHVCEIVQEILDFKNYNGQFVQRRSKAAFRKFTDNYYENMDDFSVGVVYKKMEI